MRKVTIPDSKITASHAGPVTIQNLDVGHIEINEVKLKNFKGNFTYESGTMKNLCMRTVFYSYVDSWMRFYVDLEEDLGIPGGGEVTIVKFDPPIQYLGSFESGWIKIGDIGISGGGVNLDIPETTFGPFQFTPSAIKGTQVPSVDITCIQMANTEVPDCLPSVFAADIEMPTMMDPVNASVQATKMATFSSKGIELPKMSFIGIQMENGIQVENVTIPTAQFGKPDVPNYEPNCDAEPGKLHVTTGLSDYIYLGGVPLDKYAAVNFYVRIQTEMLADSLSFNNLHADVITTNAETSEFTMDLDMSGILMCNLKLNCYSMPTIAIEESEEEGCDEYI